jgi:MFS family permease
LGRNVLFILAAAQRRRLPVFEANMADGQHSRRLFLGCFMALVATAFGFGVRSGLLGDWEVQFDLTEEQKGIINGVGLYPFAISIILFSLIVDKIGYGTAIFFGFVGHVS